MNAIHLALKLFFSFALLLTCFTSSWSGNEPTTVSDAANDHYFLSASRKFKRHGDTYFRLYHEVCNLSDKKSGLIWTKAGLALDSLNQLKGFNCARRTQYEVQELARDTSQVIFQNQSGATVDTIFKCHKLLGANTCDQGVFPRGIRSAMELSLFMKKPQELNYRMESIYISIRYSDQVVEIRIVTSDGMKNLALALDPSHIDLDVLIKELDGIDEIEVNTFSHFLKEGVLNKGFVAELLDTDSPVIVFRSKDDTSIEFSTTLKFLSTLGEMISVLAIEDGNIVASSQMHMPPERP